MSTSLAPGPVFLFDIDNTLLDNDRITADLGDYLETKFNAEIRKRYFDIFESLRNELGYADYLGALQRYRIEHPRDVRLLGLSNFLIEYPFATRLFPKALEVIAHCAARGCVAIVSDGDVVFQPHKIRQSGIFKAVGGNVLIYIHKEQMLDDVEGRFPASQYYFFDDKPRLCKAIKEYWGPRVTTVLPKQGHYAKDVKDSCPGADFVVNKIADVLNIRLSA